MTGAGNGSYFHEKLAGACLQALTGKNLKCLNFIGMAKVF
jgi:hypothetical protein